MQTYSREISLIDSVEQRPSLKADSWSAAQGISQSLMNPEVSLPYSQEPATGPYPKLYASSLLTN
jgi:hypothetical protein